uniref:Ig-like domain-containing protein n=1 Tax=Oncorhynchus mykiss TaxID=8022 RepID=A0A8K9XT63_ONCMY
MVRTRMLEAQVSVEPQVTGYLGNDVTLQCELLQGNLIQAEWQWDKSDTKTFTIAVFSPNLGQNIFGRLEFAGITTILTVLGESGTLNINASSLAVQTGQGQE